MIKVRTMKEREEEQGRTKAGKLIWEISKSLMHLNNYMVDSPNVTEDEVYELTFLVHVFDRLEKMLGYSEER